MIREAVSEAVLPMIGRALMSAVVHFAVFVLVCATLVGVVISL